MKFETVLSAYSKSLIRQGAVGWSRQNNTFHVRLIKMYYDALGLRQELDAWERLSDLTSASFDEWNDAPKILLIE